MNNKVAQCKVIFPVQKIVKVLLAKWSATSTARIRQQLGYTALIRTGFSRQAFDLAMKLSNMNPSEIEKMNEKEAKYMSKNLYKFYCKHIYKHRGIDTAC